MSMGFYKDIFELLWEKKREGIERKDAQIKTD